MKVQLPTTGQTEVLGPFTRFSPFGALREFLWKKTKIPNVFQQLVKLRKGVEGQEASVIKVYDDYTFENCGDSWPMWEAEVDGSAEFRMLAAENPVPEVGVSIQLSKRVDV